ncbi:ATP-grasp fold amidoligase family protein [Patescibacteria group bacterium]
MGKDKIKVCFLSLNSYPLFQKKSNGYFGGAELQISLIAKELAKSEKFLVCVLNRDYGQKAKIISGKVNLYRIFNKNWPRWFQRILALIILIRINPDVLVVRTANKLLYSLTLIGKIMGKRVVYMAAHNWDYQIKAPSRLTKVNRPLFIKALKRTDLVIAQTEHQKRMFKRYLGLDSTVIRSLMAAPKTNFDKRKKIILWVGRADFWKRPEIFVEMARFFPKEKMVMICRKGIDKNYFKKIRKMANRQKNMIFLESVPFEKIDQYFQQAKIFINTSTEEGFPNTFLQAGLAKTPIVSLSVNPDGYLKKYNSGYFCGHKKKALIKLTKKILANKPRQKTMGNNHYDYVVKYHSLKNINKFRSEMLRLVDKTPKKDLRYHLDKIIVSWQYKNRFKKKLDWENLKSYPEKLQYLKIMPETDKWWIYTDKLKVRDYIKSKIGEKHLFKLIDVYQSPNEIDWDKLPNQFVLKTNHGSGLIIICWDKKKFDRKAARRKLSLWLKINYYQRYRERSYRLIKPKIVCEKYYQDKKGDLHDYKFFCFDGKPKLIQVDIDRYTNHTQNFYDENWEKIKIKRCFPVFKKELKKPKALGKMLKLAKKLSEGFPHVRVDLYDVDNKIYFGEMTFTSFAGYPIFTPKRINDWLGELLVL